DPSRGGQPRRPRGDRRRRPRPRRALARTGSPRRSDERRGPGRARADGAATRRGRPPRPPRAHPGQRPRPPGLPRPRSGHRPRDPRRRVRAGGRRTDATLVAPTLSPIEPSDLDGARFCSPDVNPETREVPMGTHSTLEVLRVSLVAAWLIAGAAPSPAGA